MGSLSVTDAQKEIVCMFTYYRYFACKSSGVIANELFHMFVKMLRKLHTGKQKKIHNSCRFFELQKFIFKTWPWLTIKTFYRSKRYVILIDGRKRCDKKPECKLNPKLRMSMLLGLEGTSRTLNSYSVSKLCDKRFRA